MLQVTIPILNVLAEESVHLAGDEVTPVSSPEYLHEAGPPEGFDRAYLVARARLIHSPLEPWQTCFTACGISQNEPVSGSPFNDIGLLLDAAAAGFGVALMRLQLGAA